MKGRKPSISCAPHALIAILFPFVIKSARNPSDIPSVAEIRAMSCGVLDNSEQNAFWKLSYPIVRSKLKTGRSRPIRAASSLQWAAGKWGRCDASTLKGRNVPAIWLSL
ncbi:hypothetical protein CISG_05644 [Coccidioides immitis RMSCC 3703]|uniref:Secreted protein n=1 Tax=Coccidioides immitis RMSCC 3703 TaxID=454286 RepID=A0A0J8QWG4_COCIT|nr:hypothetical protein CISG_05644 [Coccidioides immitis RMSCC 3703]